MVVAGPRRRWNAAAVACLLAAVTALHYLTDPVHGPQHDVFRRLYYVPIVWAALSWGLRGGVVTAAVATVAYLPHAFLLPRHLDPAGNVNKALEILLYFAIGALAGWLFDSERRARDRASREAVERSQAEAVAARLEAMVRLSRGLAHEIRNPLGAIQGAMEILAEAVPLHSREAEMAAIGVREISRLDRALTGFLQFARPPPARIAPFDPAQVVLDLVRLFDEDARSKGIALRACVEEPLPEVAGDTDQVTQVLVNLVRNALDATPPGGGVELYAELMRRDEGTGRVRLGVRDTGCGVPDELGQSIYDPYVTGREQGTGLGLAIAASLVRQQAGRLRHRARPDGGTVFWFELPVVSGGGADLAGGAGGAGHG